MMAILLTTVTLAAATASTVDRTPEMPKRVVRSSDAQALDVYGGSSLPVSAIQKKPKAKADEKKR